jgi:hypothetical protein
VNVTLAVLLLNHHGNFKDVRATRNETVAIDQTKALLRSSLEFAHWSGWQGLFEFVKGVRPGSILRMEMQRYAD